MQANTQDPVFSTEQQPHTFPLAEVAKKKCSHCHATKPLSDFYRNRTRPDGYASHCKACQDLFVARSAAKRMARQTKERTRRPTTTIKQEKSVRMKPARKERKWTTVSITHEQMERIEALRNRLGFSALGDAVGFAVTTAESNSKAIEIAKARADLEAAEQRLRILSEDAAPVAKELTKVPVAAQKNNGTHSVIVVDTSIPKLRSGKRPYGAGVPKGTKVSVAGVRLCTRQGCTRPARGKYKQCLHHRREAREYQRKMTKKRERLRAISTPPGGTLETNSFLS